MGDISAALTDPTKIGVVMLLIAAVTAFFKEWVVPGNTYQRGLAERDAQIVKLTAERDEFKQMVLSALSITERSQRVRGILFEKKDEPQP